MWKKIIFGIVSLVLFLFSTYELQSMLNASSPLPTPIYSMNGMDQTIKVNGVIGGELFNTQWIANQPYLKFNGTSSYVRLDKFNPETNVTMLIYMRAENSTGVGIGNIEAGGMSLQVYDNRALSSIYINDGYKQISRDVELNKDIMYAATFDGNDYKFYFAGELVEIQTVPGKIIAPIPGMALGSSGPEVDTLWGIGTNMSGDGGRNHFLQGRVYAAEVFDEVLSAEQIKQWNDEVEWTYNPSISYLNPADETKFVENDIYTREYNAENTTFNLRIARSNDSSKVITSNATYCILDIDNKCTTTNDIVSLSSNTDGSGKVDILKTGTVKIRVNHEIKHVKQTINVSKDITLMITKSNQPALKFYESAALKESIISLKKATNSQPFSIFSSGGVTSIADSGITYEVKEGSEDIIQSVSGIGTSATVTLKGVQGTGYIIAKKKGNTNYNDVETELKIEVTGVEASDVIFTKSSSGELVYGNTITKTGNIIGTISLTYPNGVVPSFIASASVGTELDGANFEIVNNNELKVKGADLEAGKTYKIVVQGYDENGIEFSGQIHLTIEKAKQTMTWNEDSHAISASGITVGEQITLGVKDILGNVTVIYSMKPENSCVSVDETSGVVNVTCMPTSSSVTVTATPTGDSNYTETPIELTLPIKETTITKVEVTATSKGHVYTPGSWAKDEVTFELQGGLQDVEDSQYEVTTTNGNKPISSTIWSPTSGANEHNITSTSIDTTYWFRVKGTETQESMSEGIHVNLDTDAPTVPTITIESINTNVIARLLNLMSFGNWFNTEVKVTIQATDTGAGVASYEYVEVSESESITKTTTTGILTYNTNANFTLRAKAYDKAGNVSDSSEESEAILIDKEPPVVVGVKDKAIYKHYYVARTISYHDELSGIDKDSAILKSHNKEIALTQKHKIHEPGSYVINVSDLAGNATKVEFKIEKLPNMNDIDGSDDSKDIIDQIEKELDEERENLDPEEEGEYEKWLEEAKDKWEKLRKKVVENEDKTAKVEGITTNFDPLTILVVEPIDANTLPKLPRKSIEAFDVYLKKGSTEVQPNGSIKVYLPYTEEVEPIVYEIDKRDNVKELPITWLQTNQQVTFVTAKLERYAFSNMNQPKDAVCAPGIDNEMNTSDDVCANGSETQDPEQNENGSITLPPNGSVTYPNGTVIPTPEGGILQPDGSLTLPNGDEYDEQGNKKEPVNGEVNIDSDKDGKPDVNIDVDCDGKADLNVDLNGDNVPDINIDTNGDGKANYNIDIDGDGKPDVNIGPVQNPWKPSLCQTSACGTSYCTDSYYKPYLNIDTDHDGRPDVNLDLDKDDEAELNIDVNEDLLPDVNIDSTGDGKADINIDENNDGVAEKNFANITEWIPNLNVDGRIKYDTMSDIEQEKTLVNENGNTNHSKMESSKSDTGNGVETGDTSSSRLWWILIIMNAGFLFVSLFRYQKIYRTKNKI